jgi:hypothetical protein
MAEDYSCSRRAAPGELFNTVIENAGTDSGPRFRLGSDAQGFISEMRD